ncbi:30S ribosomal protein S20 [Lottiidibacillus patelloidae]|uniref:Small ribosomal subunit protein bS20 n=1 Tax=Lottiidibacillus patelloidae TaxID=2670334 RepID=A0A263BW31_9BACI|nr:30S ribosomal protein S20 [Lottiidibacillus patelloidae]OZM57762.1 30S ribosomal protein S20 [Lottiidibacillus patelloidae]
MPNIKSAIKRVKTNDAQRAHNSTIKSAMRSAVKAFEAKVANNDVEGAKVAYVEAVRKLDKAAGRNIIHKNTAARNKSRLAKQLNGLTA